ncbi:uncharacterized protein LOC135819633 [Sycon ciliatum]|uniref:uncharacterized protein LOC135819633 n=1 Tax=Sycon ciliatum TaxID=27933 RepID=UPI0031F6FD84
MISNSPTSRSLSSRAPTGKSRRALFVGVPLVETPEPGAGDMASQDALRGRVPVAVPVAAASSHRGAAPGPHGLVVDVDPEFQHRVVKVTDRFSESLVLLGNEPSLGLYRLQEHVRRSMPVLVDKKRELEQINQQVQGVCFDTEYAGSVVKDMHGIAQFTNVQELLNKAITMKQSLNSLEGPRKAPATPNMKGDVPQGVSPAIRRSTNYKPVGRASPSALAGQALHASATISGTPPTNLLPGLSTEGALKAMQQKKQSSDLDLQPKRF